MATLDDQLTASKNGVVGINAIGEAVADFASRIAGEFRSLTVTARTEIASGPGRLLAINVIVAGSASGKIYDSIMPQATAASGDGTNATITYRQAYEFATGDTVIVSGMGPSGYDTVAAGVTIVSSTSTTVTYPDVTTGTMTTSGRVFNPKPANVISATQTTIGAYSVNAPFTTGLVVDPGTSQSINVVYSLD